MLLKKLPMTIYISGQNVMPTWFTIQNICSKMSSTSCLNGYHYVTTCEIDGMVENVKNWVSHKQNVAFVWNKISFYLF